MPSNWSDDVLYRGTKDEIFVRQALSQADYSCGRWIANQKFFDKPEDSELDPQAKAAIIIAVAIYVETARLDRNDLQSALALRTVGEAHRLIDRLHPLTFGGWNGSSGLSRRLK